MTMTRRRFLYLATALVAVNSFFWLAQSGFALPQAIINQFFGGNMIRAEVLVATPAGTQDWRIDRGVITAISGTAVTLREKDATVVSLQIDPNARVQGPARVLERRPFAAPAPGCPLPPSGPTGHACAGRRR